MIKPQQRFALCLLLYLALSGIAFAQVVDIPDSNLAQAIREELALPAGSEITAQDLRRLVFLDVVNRDITNLSGLEHATNLEDLEVWDNPISDLTPIASLKQLKALDAGGCLIGDITPVANLMTLTRLLLGGNQISDISPVAKLANLTYLRLNDNQISDISPVAGLTELTHLRLSGNQISNISPVAGLTKLAHLRLSGNQIADIVPLANLMKLTELRLRNNKIEDCKPLANLINLRHLELQNNRIFDITPLANLTNLEYLDTENNPIFDPNSPLVEVPDPNLRQAVRDELNLPLDAPISQASMGQLTGFKAGDSQITDLTGLEYATNLETLRLWGNPLSDLSPIANLTKLKTLDLGHCQISNLSPLANLTRLVELQLNNNRISDITPLAHLTRLELLELDHNRITDIAPLANLMLLTELRLNNNEVGNVKPLANLAQLTELRLHNNQIEDINPLANLARLVELQLNNNMVSDIGPLANLARLIELILNNNRISDISPLAHLTRLELLHLDHNRITDITALANLVLLTELRLNNNEIGDISPLANLTRLEVLEIQVNQIVDHSSIDNLSPAIFMYDESCELAPFSVHDRINRIRDRNYPSIFTAFRGPNIANRPGWSEIEKTTSHDLWFGAHFARLSLNETSKRLTGELNNAIQRRDELLDLNPNMLFIKSIKMREYHLDEYPEDWPYWIRDPDGNIVDAFAGQYGLVDFTHPDIQDKIVQEVIAVFKCGLWDGIFFDWWAEDGAVLAGLYGDWSHKFRGVKAEQEARDNILRRIRAGTSPDFLIMGNTNREIIPRTAPHINGGFMETLVPGDGGSIGLEEGFDKIERSLLWLEQNSREPRINALEGWGVPTEAPDSPINLRYMRAITCLSLTHSDGYVVFTNGRGHTHYWYDFWDADLGRPVGPKAQLYDEDIPGLYIREFTNGWAVYNHSGAAQVITLPEEAQGVASGLVGTEHALPNLDGEMYLRKTVVSDQSPVASKNPADVNKDGVVNILDLVVVATNLSQTGENDADVNGDGLVNILDLVLVAGALGGGGAAPSAYSLDPSMISAADVATWLSQAQGLGVGDANFQRGIRFLQQLLAVLTPKETMLLPNYPNPFNPETWIAYHLAREAEVTITVYDTKGRLVRRLALGNQAAGHYAARGKAAYWDGRNERGEAVASGIYFYQFRAGDYAASRRLVILK